MEISNTFFYIKKYYKAQYSKKHLKRTLSPENNANESNGFSVNQCSINGAKCHRTIKENNSRAYILVPCIIHKIPQRIRTFCLKIRDRIRALIRNSYCVISDTKSIQIAETFLIFGNKCIFFAYIQNKYILTSLVAQFLPYLSSQRLWVGFLTNQLRHYSLVSIM